MLNLNLDFLSYEFHSTDKKDMVSFPLRIIHKRNMTVNNQTTLLNDYIRYKGSKWYDQLFFLLKEVHNEVTYSATEPKLVEIEALKALIDYIQIDDIEDWLFRVYKVKVPSSLIDNFTDDMKSDGRWNEKQTFTSTDYIRLAAEVVRLKILLGPLCYYAYINFSKMNKDHIEYTTVRVLIPTILETSKAIDKVLGMTEVLIEAVDKKLVVIDKKLPEDELGRYVTYITLIQRIATATIVDDDKDKNIIIYIYGYSNSKLVSSGDVSKMIRAKLSVSNDDNSDIDSASILESYKTVTLTTQGEYIESIWVTDSLEFILHNSPEFIVENVTDLEKVRKHFDILNKFFSDALISNFTQHITKIIFGNTLNQKAIDNIPMDNMLNLIAIGYELLNNLGYHTIADLYISREVEFSEISYNPLEKKDKKLYQDINKLYLDKGETYVDRLIEELNTSNWISHKGPIVIPGTITNDLPNLLLQIVPEIYK